MRLIAALATLVLAVGGLPVLLVAAAIARFGHASPFYGVKVPWEWSISDAQSWGRHLTSGLDSSAALVDLFFRVAIVVGWACAAVLIYTVVDEMIFQLRHGMPSARHRHLGGLGILGRKLATVLVAVLPLTITATPALIGPGLAHASIGVVHDRVADPLERFGGYAHVGVDVANAVAPSVPSVRSGWSVVEVRRGDSIWAIAERVADGRDIGVLAKQIVTANLGTMMNDGHRFSTPALIEPGWLLDVPVPALDQPERTGASPAPRDVLVDVAPYVQSENTYVVVHGDSYWKIAQDHLALSATGTDIAELTSELIAVNAPRLGYDDERLIRPGDVLQFADSPADVIVDVPVASPPAAVFEEPSTPVVIDLPAAVALPGAAPSPAALPALPLPSPVTTAGRTTASDILDEMSNNGIPTRGGLPAAIVICGGAIALLDARRRQRLRGAPIAARLTAPAADAVRTEKLLRSVNAADQLLRLDLAVRCAATSLARQHALVIAVEVADNGDIRLFTDRPAHDVADNWVLDIEGGAWRLPAEVPIAALVDDARRVHQPCPAIVHLGKTAVGQLFVDLEAVGLLSVDAAPDVAASIVRCVGASLAVSPFIESSRVFTVGLDDLTPLGAPSVESHGSLATAVEAVRATVGSITAATSGTVSTMGLRAANHGGEAWEPSVLVAIGPSDGEGVGMLATLAAGGGRGVGVIIDRPVIGSRAVLRAVDDDFVLEPLGIRLAPVGLSAADVAAVADLLDTASNPLDVAAERSLATSDSEHVEFVARPRTIVVQILGDVAIQSVGGDSITFDRSKSQELVVWLSQHRRRPTRASARTALWDVDIRDATFSNVVSDARRAMAKVVAPPSGQEWLGRTMNADLPLHDLVVSDAELLADRFAAARGLGALAAIAVLRPGVELIHGMPFAGTSYLWPDSEGITSSLVLLATSAAAELAGHYLDVGDINGVFWSTGQGLKVLAGHEELISLRMRAHAVRGDLAGVRNEWDSYERALIADTWAAGEPSPKLVELRRELLAPSLAS
ncbi:MAG TPA: LysM domain-containing protein [Ilumatobacteraceae bacterium]